MILGYESKPFKRYQSYAKLGGLPLPATDSGAARKQLLTIEQIMKDALFAILDIRKSYYLDALYTAETTFDQTHESLLWGDPVANIPEMKMFCTLHSMFIVSEDLQLVQKYMRRVRHMKAVKVPMALVSSIAQTGYHLEHAMVAATDLIEHYDDSCDVRSKLTSTIWKNGLKESVKQRYLVQKVSRLFFKIALGRVAQLYSQQYTHRPKKPQKGHRSPYIALGYIEAYEALSGSFWGLFGL
jgi:hypothetical protein